MPEFETVIPASVIQPDIYEVLAFTPPVKPFEDYIPSVDRVAPSVLINQGFFSETALILVCRFSKAILHANDVNVPEPIALVERDDQPRIGIIMGRVFGDDFSDASSSENRFLLGREVRRANEVSVPGFGLITENGAQFQNAQDYVEAEIATVMPHIQLDKNAPELLLKLWSEVGQDVAAQEPRFIHRDLKGRNVMVSESGDIVLIDLEYWNGGDPLWDAGGFLFYVLRSGKPKAEFEDFLQGYTNGKEPTDSEKLRILFYSLLSAGKFVELVARVDPGNIDYAINGLDKVSTFVRDQLNKAA